MNEKAVEEAIEKLTMRLAELVVYTVMKISDLEGEMAAVKAQAWRGRE